MRAELDAVVTNRPAIWCVVACMPNKRIGWTGTFHRHTGKRYRRNPKTFFGEILAASLRLNNHSFVAPVVSVTGVMIASRYRLMLPNNLGHFL